MDCSKQIWLHYWRQNVYVHFWSTIKRQKYYFTCATATSFQNSSYFNGTMSDERQGKKKLLKIHQEKTPIRFISCKLHNLYIYNSSWQGLSFLLQPDDIYTDEVQLITVDFTVIIYIKLPDMCREPQIYCGAVSSNTTPPPKTKHTHANPPPAYPKQHSVFRDQKHDKQHVECN